MLVLLVLVGSAHAEDDTATALREPAKLARRAHVARIGVFGLTADHNVDAEGPDAEQARFEEVPVLETRGERVRIVHDNDDARILMWLDAADLSWAITREVRIKGKGDVGVWLLRGAPVNVRGTGARRRVSFQAGELTVTGTVAESALGKVFARPNEPPFARSQVHVPTLLDAADGRALVGTPDGFDVRIVAPGSGDWQLAEHAGRYLRIRGWMRARDAKEEWGTSGSGSGSGYGMSHTPRVPVRDGTCFHARPDGPVVGIQLRDAIRYAPGNDRGWYQLYVGNAWGLFRVHARVESTDAQGNPIFARCR